jgi:hypothetical protein
MCNDLQGVFNDHFNSQRGNIEVIASTSGIRAVTNDYEVKYLIKEIDRIEEEGEIPATATPDSCGPTTTSTTTTTALSTDLTNVPSTGIITTTKAGGASATTVTTAPKVDIGVVPDLVIIDVRTQTEWDKGHISCAVGPLAIQDDPAGWEAQVEAMTGGSKKVKIVYSHRVQGFKP